VNEVEIGSPEILVEFVNCVNVLFRLTSGVLGLGGLRFHCFRDLEEKRLNLAAQLIVEICGVLGVLLEQLVEESYAFVHFLMIFVQLHELLAFVEDGEAQTVSFYRGRLGRNPLVFEELNELPCLASEVRVRAQQRSNSQPEVSEGDGLHGLLLLGVAAEGGLVGLVA